MTALKRICAFLLLVVASSCIDPYIPYLKNYKSLLVVDGLITNENNSYKIRLCRTTSQVDSDPEKVTDANVSITDGDGVKSDLKNCGNGYYKTDSTSFTGVIGQKYTLSILTGDGKVYKSEECTMIPVAGIDRLYYEKGEEISGILGEFYTGLKIMLNSTDATGINNYFRWTFEEIWKYRIPYPREYIYAHVNDTTFNFESVPAIKTFCWKTNQSGEIITSSILSGEENYINKKEIQFIAPLKSDRLTIQYSILVKQYSVSKKEYEFWNNLNKTGKAGGDIFASQPYLVISNIHCISSPGEMVLGYFEVSAVSRKRIFITANELDSLNLPHHKTDCAQIMKSPDDFGASMVTWEDIYHMYTDDGKYVFIAPDVTPGTIIAGHVFAGSLLEFIFAPTVCTECDPSGSEIKPDFWIDLQ